MTYIPGINHGKIPPCFFSSLILSVMAYPNVAKRGIETLFRKESIRLLRFVALEEDTDMMNTFRQENPLLEGMCRLILDIPCDEDERIERFKDGLLAGEILIYILRLDKAGHEGSVSKSVYIIENLKKISRSKLMKIWSEYKNVSYYYAALILLFRGAGANPFEIFKKAIANGEDEHEVELGLYSFYFYVSVNLSMYLCKWATARIEKRTRQPLLNLRDTWTVPTAFLKRAWNHCEKLGFSKDSFGGERPMPSLTTEESALLESYKANQKF
ncbi:hypothetical protein [Solidesulfovibrio sp. C21]|uniref:hypothetical protein n=1 Tax=Solidesulfovibrio sp. C21 TaxID=3398613 RepID=UPI0039FC6AF3